MSLLIAKTSLQQELDLFSQDGPKEDFHEAVGRIVVRYLTEEMMNALSKLKKEVGSTDITDALPDFNADCVAYIVQELSDGRIRALVQNFVNKIDQEPQDTVISIGHFSQCKSLQVVDQEEVVSVGFAANKTQSE